MQQLCFTVLLLIQFNGHYATKHSIMNGDRLQLNASDFATDDLRYISVTENLGSSGGLLVIIPDIQFNSYGSVLSWSGLIAVEARAIRANRTLDIYFQVWRPANDNTSFNLAGSDLLEFDSIDFEEEEAVYSNMEGNRETYYYPFTDKVGTYTDHELGILFQPGDVVGCFIPVSSMNSSESLGFVFSNVTSRDIDDKVDLMLFPTGELTCGASVCDKSLMVITSVVTQIYPMFHELSNEASDFQYNNVKCSNKSSTTCTKTNDDACNGDSDGCYTVPGLLAVIAALCVTAACIIGLVANSITLCVTRRKAKRMERDRKFMRANRQQASSPFIINQYVLQNDPMLKITSLADYLQYNMQIESANTELHNISWV